MSPEEKAQILNTLQTSRQNLLDAVQGTSPELAEKRPDAERWSVLECVEHLAIAEEFLLAKAKTAEPLLESTYDKVRERLILRRGGNRSHPQKAPDAVLPNRRFSSLAEAVQAFLAARQDTIQFVESCAEDLRCKRTEHPLLGPMNAHEVLLLIAVHPDRHAPQIAELRGSGL